MPRSIATIGYEKSSIDQFIETLRAAAINLLIDVRDLPLSRKKGFSKNILAANLAEHRIDYVHLKGLGDPKDGRMAARAGNYKLFERIFSTHMQTDKAQHDLAVAAKLVRSNRACLMCYECDHDCCHRKIVADQLAEITGLEIDPLRVNLDISPKIILKPNSRYVYA